MALLEKSPTHEPTSRQNEAERATPKPPPATAPAQPTETTVWPALVERVAIAVVALGVVVSTSLGVINTDDIASLQSQVESLQNQTAATQNQLAGVQADLATLAGLPTAQDLAADQATMLAGKLLASKAHARLPVITNRSSSDLAEEQALIVAGKIAAAQAHAGLPVTR